MDAHKLQLKIFAQPGGDLALEAFIPVFHRWIKDHLLEGDTLVDVANYAHVPQGPGVVLIGHAGDYFLDEGEGRRGLLFNRKRVKLPPGERLADAFRNAIRAAQLLEAEPTLGGFKFRTDEWRLRINDRLLAPNTAQTFASLRPELEAFCRTIFAGAEFELSHVSAGAPKQLFAVQIATRPALPLPTLLARLPA